MEFLNQCSIERAYNEMHVLAYIYHWDRDSLWNIPISERRKWVEIVMQQKNSEREAMENHK